MYNALQEKLSLLEFEDERRNKLQVLLERVPRGAIQRIALLIVGLCTCFLLLLPGSSLPHGFGQQAQTSLSESSIYNATLGFQKIYIINLPTRVDRRGELTLAESGFGLQFDWITPYDGDKILDVGLPDGASEMTKSAKSVWISNMMIFQDMLEHGIQSALILEDDADFDIYIREQLVDFASASRFLQSSAAPRPERGDSDLEVPFEHIINATSEIVSPYGDSWDVLWLGHRGIRIPSERFPDSTDSIALHTTVVKQNDTTMPSLENVHTIDDPNWMRDLNHRKSHTRLYHGVADGIGAQGIAVSHQGARRPLYEFMSGHQRIGNWDLALTQYCHSSSKEERRICVTTQPSLVSQFKEKGDGSKNSNIEGSIAFANEKAESQNIKFSWRMNLGELLRGGHDFVDQFEESLS